MDNDLDHKLLKFFGVYKHLSMATTELAALESSLLNKSGDVPLHNRFRALFTLKSLKNKEAIRIISEGINSFQAIISDQNSSCR